MDVELHQIQRDLLLESLGLADTEKPKPPKALSFVRPSSGVFSSSVFALELAYEVMLMQTRSVLDEPRSGAESTKTAARVASETNSCSSSLHEPVAPLQEQPPLPDVSTMWSDEVSTLEGWPYDVAESFNGDTENSSCSLQPLSPTHTADSEDLDEEEEESRETMLISTSSVTKNSCILQPPSPTRTADSEASDEEEEESRETMLISTSSVTKNSCSLLQPPSPTRTTDSEDSDEEEENYSEEEESEEESRETLLISTASSSLVVFEKQRAGNNPPWMRMSIFLILSAGARTLYSSTSCGITETTTLNSTMPVPLNDAVFDDLFLNQLELVQNASVQELREEPQVDKEPREQVEELQQEIQVEEGPWEQPNDKFEEIYPFVSFLDEMHLGQDIIVAAKHLRGSSEASETPTEIKVSYSYLDEILDEALIASVKRMATQVER
jgi:hypothetical protein